MLCHWMTGTSHPVTHYHIREERGSQLFRWVNNTSPCSNLKAIDCVRSLMNLHLPLKWNFWLNERFPDFQHSLCSMELESDHELLLLWCSVTYHTHLHAVDMLFPCGMSVLLRWPPHPTDRGVRNCIMQRLNMLARGAAWCVVLCHGLTVSPRKERLDTFAKHDFHVLNVIVLNRAPFFYLQRKIACFCLCILSSNVLFLFVYS